MLLLFWVVIFLADSVIAYNSAQPLGQFQFYPALQFLFSLGKIGPGLITILLFTLLWGRVYCSSLCPLGTLQDAVIGLSKKAKLLQFHSQKNYRLLRYGILLLASLTIALGTLLLIQLLEPFSLFGKFMGTVLAPLLYWFSLGVEAMGLGQINPGTFHPVPLIFFLLFLGIGLILAVFTWKKGRLFCNTLCPVGALLGSCSRASFYQLDLQQETCIDCKKCEGVCKAGCIDLESKSIDNERCVRCFNCLEICPVNAIDWRKGRKKSKRLKEKPDVKEEPDQSRKSFLRTLGQLGLAATALLLPLKHFGIQRGRLKKQWRTLPILPPGTKDTRHFGDNCISCHLCVSHCPTQVLQPQWGLSFEKGLFQPALDYTKSYCEYKCHTCSQVCPTQAITKVSLKEKQQIQLGRARLIKEYCLVYANDQACGACAEHCPTIAVKMEPYKGALWGPVTQDHFCIGCGHCEFVCPALPWKAIYIEPFAVHTRSQLPETGEIKKDKQGTRDFPF